VGGAEARVTYSVCGQLRSGWFVPFPQRHPVAHGLAQLTDSHRHRVSEVVLQETPAPFDMGALRVEGREARRARALQRSRSGRVAVSDGWPMVLPGPGWGFALQGSGVACGTQTNLPSRPARQAADLLGQRP